MYPTRPPRDRERCFLEGDLIGEERLAGTAFLLMVGFEGLVLAVRPPLLRLVVRRLVLVLVLPLVLLVLLRRRLAGRGTRRSDCRLLSNHFLERAR